MKIGILVIATGKYITFVQPLWDSVKKYFFTKSGDKVSMFVFTDAKETPVGTIRCFQEHEKFPAPTLLRYEWFLKQKMALEKMDYLFYCDADMLFKDYVGREILGKLVATIHPGFFTKPRKFFTYEKNPNSLAYVPEDKGRYYYCGGFQGGVAKEYLNLCKVLAVNIRRDLKKDIIAEHNDESHFNSYLITHPPDIILLPIYCFPEQLTTEYQVSHLKDKTDYYRWFPDSLREFADKPKLVAILKNHSSVRYSGFEAVYKNFVMKIVTTLAKISKMPSWISKVLTYNLMKRCPGIWTRGFYNQKLSKVLNISCYVDSPNYNVIDLVTVGFNNASVIETQIKLLKKNLQDSFSYTVADNSTDAKARQEILKICKRYLVGYISLPENPLSQPGLGNLSHGSAMTWVYKNFITNRPYQYFGFLDHDIFPIKKTSLMGDFKKSPVLGICQPRKNTWYLWAGFCFFDKKFIGCRKLDFLSKRYGEELLDTGGANWGSLYSKVDYRKLPIFRHKYLNLTGGDIAQHDMVEFFGDWLHLFNASDWYKMDPTKKMKRDRAILNLLKKYEYT